MGRCVFSQVLWFRIVVLTVVAIVVVSPVLEWAHVRVFDDGEEVFLGHVVQVSFGRILLFDRLRGPRQLLCDRCECGKSNM